jgi:hypothetical protein
MRQLLLVTLLISLSSETGAESFRCGRKIVKPGDSGNTLIKKCGNPARKFSGKQSVFAQGRRSNVSVSNWVYKRHGKKDMIISVRSGAVVKIQVE